MDVSHLLDELNDAHDPNLFNSLVGNLDCLAKDRRRK